MPQIKVDITKLHNGTHLRHKGKEDARYGENALQRQQIITSPVPSEQKRHFLALEAKTITYRLPAEAITGCNLRYVERCTQHKPRYILQSPVFGGGSSVELEGAMTHSLY